MAGPARTPFVPSPVPAPKRPGHTDSLKCVEDAAAVFVATAVDLSMDACRLFCRLRTVDTPAPAASSDADALRLRHAMPDCPALASLFRASLDCLSSTLPATLLVHRSLDSSPGTLPTTPRPNPCDMRSRMPAPRTMLMLSRSPLCSRGQEVARALDRARLCCRCGTTARTPLFSRVVEASASSSWFLTRRFASTPSRGGGGHHGAAGRSGAASGCGAAGGDEATVQSSGRTTPTTRGPGGCVVSTTTKEKD